MGGERRSDAKSSRESDRVLVVVGIFGDGEFVEDEGEGKWEVCEGE